MRERRGGALAAGGARYGPWTVGGEAYPCPCPYAYGSGGEGGGGVCDGWMAKTGVVGERSAPTAAAYSLYGATVIVTYSGARACRGRGEREGSEPPALLELELDVEVPAPGGSGTCTLRASGWMAEKGTRPVFASLL